MSLHVVKAEMIDSIRLAHLTNQQCIDTKVALSNSNVDRRDYLFLKQGTIEANRGELTSLKNSKEDGCFQQSSLSFWSYLPSDRRSLVETEFFTTDTGRRQHERPILVEIYRINQEKPCTLGISSESAGEIQCDNI